MKRAFMFVLMSGLLASSAVAFASRPVASSRSPASQAVPADANIFAAGLATAPILSGGGGSLPPVWELPTGSVRVVTFPRIVGAVRPTPDREAMGAAGRGVNGRETNPTNITSWRGISGIVNKRNTMFLVGVFLGDARPTGPAPPRLDFTGNEDFTVLAPRIGQTFFVGAGKASYRVPAGATRLFLGFARAFGPPYNPFQGTPSTYGPGRGSLQVTARVTVK